jgi:hypothetical protein
MSMKVCPCTRGKYDPEPESMCGQCEREWTDKWGNIPRQNPSSGPHRKIRGFGAIDPRRR